MTVSVPRGDLEPVTASRPIAPRLLQAAGPDDAGRRAGPQPRAGSDPRALLQSHQRLAFAGDMLSGLAAGAIGLVVRFGDRPPAPYVGYAAVITAVWLMCVAAQRGYETRFLGTGPEEYRRVADAGILLFAVIAMFAYAFRESPARGFVFVAVPLTVVLSFAVRHRLRKRIYRLRLRGEGLQRVLVVGRADAAVSLIEKLDAEPHHGLVPVAACLPASDLTLNRIGNVPIVGDPSRVLEAVDRSGAHVVAIVSHPDMSGQALRRLSWALEERDIELIVSPGIIEVAGPRLSIRPIAGLSLLHLERPSAKGGRMFWKRAIDATLGGAILLLVAPFLLAVAAAIRLTSKGGALFRQTRVGVDGREFTMYKFRSMVVDAEERRTELLGLSDGNDVMFKMRKDPRVTPVGRFLRRLSIDELPQLINVVRGDMSLVGPRPPLPEEVAGYNDDASRRLKVRPGVTGLWQVSGRSDLSWEESLRLDLRYADNWSIALDVLILWRTFRAVVQGAGAY
jgi:exopolysaccharide biosynthesis polyprenyl glycosylphosphotransferase